MKKIMIALLLLVTLTLTACTEEYVQDEYKEVVNYIPLIEGELYYIPHEYGVTDFPRKYEAFKKENDNLEVLDVESDLNEEDYNSVNGYFVFTKEQ